MEDRGDKQERVEGWVAIDAKRQGICKMQFRRGWNYRGICADRCGEQIIGSEEIQHGDGQAEHLHQDTDAQEDDEIHGDA
ncbi:MAG: hypothetical protein H8K04_19150 [Nitrospira sp.]